MRRASRFKEAVSQKTLSHAIDVIHYHISEIENGKRPIGKQMAQRLAEFFKMDDRFFL